MDKLDTRRNEEMARHLRDHLEKVELDIERRLKFVEVLRQEVASLRATIDYLMEAK